MRKRLKENMIFFTMILSFLLINNLVVAKIINGVEVPTTTKEIEFELEVIDTVKIEPVHLDFGNILKNSTKLIGTTSYFELSGAYLQDMFISTSFQNGIEDGDYTKFEVFREGMSSGDFLNVYLYNIKPRILSSGETRIPIVGEIREVGDIALGKYEKIVVMDIIIAPVSPIKN